MKSTKSAPLAFEDTKREIRRLVDERWAPGDRVPTAADLAKILGVGLTNTYRAVKALADDGVLVTRVGRGTFVAETSTRDHVDADDAPSIGIRVYLLSHARHCEHAGVLMSRMARTFDATLDLDWQLNVLAPMNGLVVARELMAASETMPRKAGFVLVGCPREVQEMAQQAGVPALVWGNVYSTIKHMAFVSSDQARIGELMCEHALGLGHKRLALLFPDVWNPGEDAMLAAIQKTLHNARLGLDALVINSMPPKEDVVDQMIHDLFERENPPTALLCRERMVAQRASLYLKQSGREALVVFDGTTHSGVQRGELSYVGAVDNPEHQVQLVGRMITQMILGQKLEQDQIVLPVQFVDAV